MPTIRHNKGRGHCDHSVDVGDETTPEERAAGQETLDRHREERLAQEAADRAWRPWRRMGIPLEGGGEPCNDREGQRR